MTSWEPNFYKEKNENNRKIKPGIVLNAMRSNDPHTQVSEQI